MTLSLLILLRVVLKNVAVAVVAALTIAPPILHMQPGAGQATKLLPWAPRVPRRRLFHGLFAE